MKKLLSCIVFCLSLSCHPAKAQLLAVRTNLLYDMALVPSAGAELMLSDWLSLCIDGSWMPLRQSSNHYWRTWNVQPSLRYWPTASMAGPFVGGCFQWRGYNLGGLPFSHLRDSRSQGTMWGGGIIGGWHQILSTRWSLELSASVGYARLHYDHYDAPRSTVVSSNVRKGYLGLLDGGVTLVYIIK